MVHDVEHFGSKCDGGCFPHFKDLLQCHIHVSKIRPDDRIPSQIPICPSVPEMVPVDTCARTIPADKHNNAPKIHDILNILIYTALPTDSLNPATTTASSE